MDDREKDEVDKGCRGKDSSSRRKRAGAGGAAAMATDAAAVRSAGSSGRSRRSRSRSRRSRSRRKRSRRRELDQDGCWLNVDWLGRLQRPVSTLAAISDTHRSWDGLFVDPPPEGQQRR